MKKIMLRIILLMLLAVGISVMYPQNDNNDIIARYLTNEHYRYNPVVLNEKLYFPSNFMKDYYENTEGIGLLGHKDKGLFNDLFFSSGMMRVDKNDSELINFIVRDDFSMDYLKADYLNSINVVKDNLNKHSNFVLCNDSNGKETRTSVDKELLVELVSEFGEITYNIDDYINADEIYYIYVDSPNHTIHDRTFDNPIVYLGTIFIDDNKFFHGNLNNEIKNELLNTLNETLNISTTI